MTGKSELTSSLCARLSEVLEIDSRSLLEVAAHDLRDQPLPAALAQRLTPGRVSYQLPTAPEGSSIARVCQTLEEYAADADGLARTFETLPPTDDGRRLKRVLMDAIEDIAMERAIKLPQAFFDLRRAVVNGDA
jgi:hypothetical protein